jgi:Fe-S-cluster containining protein
VWLGAARRIGLRVVRTPDAYAATDGRGTLAIGAPDTLDADDSLAQMIFHELCHSLVEGEDSFTRPDWGMEPTESGGPEHDWREHACLRTQYVVSGRHGLRGLFAPTTDFRAFWDALSGDVLADRTDRSVQAAIAALRRADQPPWAPALTEALEATARIAQASSAFADAATLWGAVESPPARHPTGLASGAIGSCGTCAWRFEQRGASRCRQAASKVDPSWAACERYEAALDCQTCGACCRAAYHSVEVARRDPAVKAQPDYIVDRGTYLEIRRNGDRCAALHGGGLAPNSDKQTRFHCVIYDDRPRTCREFTLGSEHCLTARRRVGLSL